MATFKGLPAFQAEIVKTRKDIEKSIAKITREMGVKAQGLATREASADLGGDPKFSGWEPLLDTQLKSKRGGSTWMLPTRSSAGPWTVAQRGRNQGNASGFAGPGINKRTGVTSRTKAGNVRKVRAAASRRWNGVTAGKGTADSVNAAMEKELPKIAETGIRDVLKRHFDIG